MKTVKIITAFLLTMAFSTGVMAQQQSATDGKEQLVVPLSEPGKPYKLKVHMITGSIKVVGYEGKDVVIDISQEDNDRNDRKKVRVRDRMVDVEVNTNVNVNGGKSGSGGSAGMKRITAGRKLDVSAEEKSNSITVHTSVTTPVSLVIKVPMSQSKMQISTINEGDVVISNVNGEFEVNNTNGPITMTGISGSVVATALNENIKVVFKSIDPNAPMAFSSLNGNIDVTFPATLKANVKLKTDNGDMFTDFDIDADKTATPAKKTSSNGTYRINIENWVYGKINAGGPELMMKNMNGNIYIRKAK
jgi:hypothetical protein